MNIIRIKLPEGVQRFKPFTVKDYRDFLLVSTEIKMNPEEEQTILDELLEEIYPEVDPAFREYIFLNVFTSSIGKTKIPLCFTCPTCNKERRMLLNLQVEALKPIVLEAAGLKITFRYVKPSTDYAKTFLDAIERVSDGINDYLWTELPEEVREQVIDSISFAEFEEVVKQMHTIKIEQKISCCESHDLKYIGLLPLFKLLLNPDELFIFYRINHLLAKSNYSISDLMDMLPVERNIALTLVEKDVKEANNAKNGVS